MCMNVVTIYRCKHYANTSVEICPQLFKGCLGPKAVDLSDPWTTDIKEENDKDCYEWCVALIRSLSWMEH